MNMAKQENRALSTMIEEQTRRALWEIKNVIDCIPDELWCQTYSGMPLYKHVYHTLHSLDQWFINPCDPSYQQPSFHVPNLNNLDIVTERYLSRDELLNYYDSIKKKIMDYLSDLEDCQLLEKPEGSPYPRMTLILGQFRHLHTHMGMLMGFLIDDLDKWPRVLGLESAFPEGDYDPFF